MTQWQKRKQWLIASLQISCSLCFSQPAFLVSRAFLLPSCSHLTLRQGKVMLFLPTVATLSADVATMKPRLGPANGLPWRSVQSATGHSYPQDPIAFGFLHSAFVKGNLRFRVLSTHIFFMVSRSGSAQQSLPSAKIIDISKYAALVQTEIWASWHTGSRTISLQFGIYGYCAWRGTPKIYSLWESPLQLPCYLLLNFHPSCFILAWRNILLLDQKPTQTVVSR